MAITTRNVSHRVNVTGVILKQRVNLDFAEYLCKFIVALHRKFKKLFYAFTEHGVDETAKIVKTVRRIKTFVNPFFSQTIKYRPHMAVSNSEHVVRLAWMSVSG